MRIVSDESFRALTQRERAEDVVILKSLLPAIEQEDDGSAKFVISTPDVDRLDHVISANGWKLEQYLANPVVLWAHDRKQLPIAKAPRTFVEDGKLVSIAEFADHPFARTVRDLVFGGFLRAASVGMRPIKYEFAPDPERPDGINFYEQELLEWSIVPVPANPNTLIAAKAADIDIEPLVEWAKHLCGHEHAPEIPRGRCLRALRTAVTMVRR